MIFYKLSNNNNILSEITIFPEKPFLFSEMQLDTQDKVFIGASFITAVPTFLPFAVFQFFSIAYFPGSRNRPDRCRVLPPIREWFCRF